MKAYSIATVRQWVSLMIANILMLLTAVLAVLNSYRLRQLTRSSTLSETDAAVYSWSYVLDDVGRVIAYAYPPLLLWAGFIVFFACASSLGPDPRGLGVTPNIALAGPFNAAEQQRGPTARSERNQRRRTALKNLKAQLRARGHAGLLRGRVSVRVGLGMLGTAMIMVSALLAPAGVTTGDPQRGILRAICLGAGGLVMLCLLLSFPYGHRATVTVDAAGNVRDQELPAPV